MCTVSLWWWWRGDYHSCKEENIGKSGQDTDGQEGEETVKGDTEEAGKAQLQCKVGLGG